MDFDAFKDALRDGVKELAKNTVKDFAEDAKTDMEAFVDDTKGDLERWTMALADGTLTQEETSVNLDFVKTWDDSPMNLGFGLEWRNETYVIDSGDPASVQTGPTFAEFGVDVVGWNVLDAGG